MDDIISALKCASIILAEPMYLMPCQVTAARKNGNPPGWILLRVTSGQWSGVGAIGFNLTLLGKHQTHFQDCVAEKSGENKKDPRKNLRHHEGILPKGSVNQPQFFRDAHHMKDVISNGYCGDLYRSKGCNTVLAAITDSSKFNVRWR